MPVICSDFRGKLEIALKKAFIHLYVTEMTLLHVKYGINMFLLLKTQNIPSKISKIFHFQLKVSLKI